MKPKTPEKASNEPVAGLKEMAVRWAESHPVVMVRLPRRAKLFGNFRYRLADAAEVHTYGHAYRIFMPATAADARDRYYLLSARDVPAVAYLAGVLRALAGFKLLAVAEVFLADAQDQLLRRVVPDVGLGLPRGEWKGAR